VFLRENPQLTEIDSGSKSGRQYPDWQKSALNLWCIKHRGEYGVPAELYWRVREKLNIWAEARAMCDGESGKFLVDRETRARTATGCSFILLCEKKTVSAELLTRLKAEGYKVNLISTGGFSPSDVQEAVLQIAEELDEDEPTFYFLVLHDFDLEGVQIYFNLKARYSGVIDVGVNSELFHCLNEQGTFDSRLVEEQRLNKSYQGQLKETIEEGDSAYSVDDFEYLQGVQQPSGKEWIGKRIEIDAIHVQYGIEPFITYIKKKINEECLQWDLKRIGLQEHSLLEPDNPFEDVLNTLSYAISTKQHETWQKISKPLVEVNEFVKKTLSEFSSDLAELTASYGIKRVEGETFADEGMDAYMLSGLQIEALKQKYDAGFERVYVPDYEDELDEWNAKIHCYKGDVTTAIEDMNEEYEDLQNDVNDAASTDEEAQAFEEELGQFDWGEEEFDKITVPDEKQVIRAVIEKLTERLKKLENNGHNDADSEGGSHD
jgi:hypothetical protein